MGKKDRAAVDEDDAGRGAAAKARAKELRKEGERRAAKKQERHAKKAEPGAGPGKSAGDSDDDDAPKGKSRAAEVEPAKPKPKSKSVCNFFLAGTCKRGAGCAFLHEDPSAASSGAAPDSGGEGEAADCAAVVRLDLLPIRRRASGGRRFDSRGRRCGHVPGAE